ncbi:MAG: MCP four helix bundle domain-containing protein [Rhodoferax sp.]|nr:MCP four helix bundle domain-containing protein [Rhodoferax sp.]
MDISAWKVRTRLSFGFGSVCLLLLVIVGIAWTSLARIQEGLTDVVDDRWPKIEASTAIMAQTDAIAIALRNMMLTADATDRQKQIESIAKSRELIKQNVELLDRTVTLAKGKELLQQLKDQRSKYIAGQDALMALIAADKPDEAKAYLANQLRPVLGAYKTAIAALIDLQVGLINATAKGAAETYAQARTTLITLGLLVLALSAAVGWLITRSLLKELGGEPRAAADLARAVAQGDFTQTTTARDGDQNSLMAHLGAMQSSLARVVSEVRSGSEAVATASAEIAQGNQDLSSRTESQASALEQTAASMEQLGATVKQNADSARQANQLSMSASTVAVRGGEVVGQVVETMKGINDSSRKIGDIISVIDGIAFQTNILALNAAVEAARAGEQGRGFAVVASEVRSLAGRSAEAAKEIKSLINASVERVEQGSALVDQAGITMTEVVSSIRRVTDIMGEISAASNEQSLGVSQVGEAVTQMDQATQQNAALVEEMAAAASSLKSQAQELVQVVAVFKLGAGQDHHPVAKLAAVRSREPKAQPHGGAQRRLAGVAKGAAARGHGSAAKATHTAPAVALPLADMRSKTVSKATPAGGDADWESF